MCGEQPPPTLQGQVRAGQRVDEHQEPMTCTWIATVHARPTEREIMTQHRVTAVQRSSTGMPSRRDVLRGLTGAGLSLGPGAQWVSNPAEARRRRRHGCRHGKTRLSNGSCAIVCTALQDCPTDTCNGCGNPNTEGGQHCSTGALAPLTPCATTKNCPRGSDCQDLGGSRVCIELCH